MASRPYFPHTVHFHHYSTKGYSPASKSADISRLLDPSYSSSSSSYSESRYKVYVDQHGDLHDPDYRHFPDLASMQQTKKQRRTSDPLNNYSRPSWELGNEIAVEDDDDDAVSNEPIYQPYSLQRRRSSSRSHRAAYPSYPNYISSSPSSISSPLSTSLDSEDTYVDASSYSSSYDEKNVLKKKPRSPCSFSFSRPRSSLDSGNRPSTPPSVVEEFPVEERSQFDDDDDDDEEFEGDAKEQQDGEDRVTRSDALKKEWQAVQLKVRIGVFRMKRRVKDAMR